MPTTRKSHKLSVRSEKKLGFCHPDLQKVIRLAITRTEIDFTIVQTKRTRAQQMEFLRKGLSTTSRSRHLMNRCEYEGGEIVCCHAVDLAHWIGGRVRWDWPLYHKLEPVIKGAARDLKIPIEWGGDWRNFPDGPHWQLPWKEYPIL